MLESGHIYVVPLLSTPNGGYTREYIYHAKKSREHGTQIFCQEAGDEKSKNLIVTFPPQNGAMQVHDNSHLQQLNKLFNKQGIPSVQCRRNKSDTYVPKTGAEFKQFFRDNLVLAAIEMDALQGKAQAPAVRAEPKTDLFPKEIEIGAVRADKDTNYVVEKVVARTQQADGQISEQTAYKLYAATRDEKILLLAQDPNHPNRAEDLQFFYPPANIDLGFVDLGAPKATHAEIDPSTRTQEQFTRLREALKKDSALKEKIILLMPNRDVKTALSKALDKIADDFKYPPTREVDTDIVPPVPLGGASAWGLGPKDAGMRGEKQWSPAQLIALLEKNPKYTPPPPPPPPMLAPEPPAEPPAPPPRPKNFVHPLRKGEKPRAPIAMPVTAQDSTIPVPPPPPPAEYFLERQDKDYLNIDTILGADNTPAEPKPPTNSELTSWVESNFEIQPIPPLTVQEQEKKPPERNISYVKKVQESRDSSSSLDVEFD